MMLTYAISLRSGHGYSAEGYEEGSRKLHCDETGVFCEDVPGLCFEFCLSVVAVSLAVDILRIHSRWETSDLICVSILRRVAYCLSVICFQPGYYVEV